MYVAAATCGGTFLQGLKLAKGQRDRLQEEELVSRLIIQVNTWLAACGGGLISLAVKYIALRGCRRSGQGLVWVGLRVVTQAMSAEDSSN